MDEYEALKRENIRGWHTWNVSGVLSFVHMPDGFAVNLCVKEYREGNYLKNALIGDFGGDKVLPGPHAFDDSYAELTVEWKDILFRCEFTSVSDELVLIVTPEKMQLFPAALVAETGVLWNLGGGERQLYITGGEPSDDKNIPAQGRFYTVAMTGSVVICTGRAWSFKEARTLMDARREALLKTHESYGEKSELFSALECALMWDTIYEPNKNRVISPVSRLWCSGGYVLFCWDNFFAGFMHSFGNKFLAYSNLIEIATEADLPFVPNFSQGTGMVSRDRSQPPVGSAMVWEVYKKFGDRWLLEKLYPKFLSWNEWFFEHRSNLSGTLSWGSDPYAPARDNCWETNGVNGRFGAALESGLDNSPMYDSMPFDTETHKLMLEDVGLTGLYIMDCAALAKIARELSLDCSEIAARKEKAEAGLETLWDEEFGLYLNRRTDTGEFSYRISPTNFYALFSDRVSKKRARRMIDGHYFNPREFYGEWVMPSIARCDPAYPDNDYWRGRIWAPLNFLVWMAMENKGVDDARDDLREKSRKLFMKEWREHRHVHENYNSETGEGCDVKTSDKFYHWGALLCAISLTE